MSNIRKEADSFPGQERGEKIYLFLRRHPLSFLGFFLIALFMILTPLILYFAISQAGNIEFSDLTRRIIIVLISAYSLFVLGFFLVGWIDYYLDVVIITDRRIIDINQDRLFARNIAEANLVDVEDVNAEVKGVLNTLFHYGTVHVQTAGTLMNFEFRYIPDPYKVSKMIANLHEEAVEEEEKREAKKIGETIAEKASNNHLNGEEITRAAKILSAKNKEKKMPKTRQEIRREEEDKPMDYKEYGDSDMAKRGVAPPSGPEPDETEAEPEENNKDKEKNSLDHEELEKGGEIDIE